MSVRSVARWVAVPVAALLLAGTAPTFLGSASATGVTGGSVSPSSAINAYNSGSTPRTTLAYSAPGAQFPSGPNTVTVSVLRALDHADALSPIGNSSVATTKGFPPQPITTDSKVSQDFNLDRANPGYYDILVTDKSTAANLAYCSSCFLVLAYAPECTGFVQQGDGTWAVTGTSFAKTTNLQFPVGSDPTNPKNDDVKLRATPAPVSPSNPTPSTATRNVYSLDTSQAAGGDHAVVVRNTANQTGVCPRHFTVPRGLLVASLPSVGGVRARPAGQVQQIGRNSASVPFMVQGGPGLTADTSIVVDTPFQKTNGVSAVNKGLSSDPAAPGLNVELSATTDADLSHRNVVFVAPDGGFFADPNGLAVEAQPGVDDKPGTGQPSPSTIGQGAVNVPLQVTVPTKTGTFAYDGGGLSLLAGCIPGLSLTFNRFVGTPAADAQYATAEFLVSTVRDDTTPPPACEGNTKLRTVRAAVGSYTLQAKNANGGLAPSAGATSGGTGDGSCASCFTVQEGPIVTSISPSSVSPNSTVTLHVTGTGFVPDGGGPLSPTPTVVSFPTSSNFTVTSTAVASATSLDVTVQVGGAPGGAFDLKVTNPDDFGTFTYKGGLNVSGLAVGAPTPPTSVNDAPITLTVSGGPFVPSSSITLQRNGFTPIPGTVDAANSTTTKLVATFHPELPAPAGPGSWDVAVTNPPSGGSTTPTVGLCQQCFTFSSRQPLYTSSSPSGAPPGARLDLSVVGDFFAENSTVRFLETQGSSGITVLNGARTIDRRHLVVPLLVRSNAKPGAQTFSVVNSDGTASPNTSPGTFTISQPPTATKVSPASRGANSPTFTMTISGTNIASARSVTFGAGGITAGTPTTSNSPGASTVTAPVTIAKSVPPGTYDVTVNDSNGGSAACAKCLTVTAAPTVSGAAPAVLPQGGTKQSLAISGSNLTGPSGDAVLSFGPGVTLSSGSTPVVAKDGNSATATVDVSPSAARGPVTVTASFPVASDGTGGGSGSCDVCLRVATVPGAPTLDTATGSNAAVDLSWTAPADGGSGITSYGVVVTPAAGTVTVAGTKATVTGLTNGTAYTFTVAAQNAVGKGAASNALTAKPVSVPAPPTGVTASAGNASAVVSWTTGSDNGSAITGYTVTSTPGGITATATGTTATVTGLTNGTAYTFHVVATNAYGDSPASTESAPVTPTVGLPGAPTGLAASTSRAANTVDLTWAAPAANGSPAVSRYRVTVSPADGTVTYPADRTATSAVVSGLTAGTAYTFTVIADNSDGVTPADGSGEGPASSPATATPTAPPTATPPASTGGHYVALSAPVRVLDTRDGTGGTQGLRNGTITLDLSRVITDPSASAAVLNVTVANPTGAGFLVAYPDGTSRPPTSNLNFVRGQVQANEVITRLPASRTVVLEVANAAAYVIVDLVGYDTTASPAGAALIAPITPRRVLDTRLTASPRRSGEVVLDLTGIVPDSATTAVLNVTVTNASAPGFVVAYPSDAGQPGTSNVNFGRGQTQANEVTTRLSADHKVTLKVVNAFAAVIADLVGYSTPLGGSGLQYTPLTAPLRIVDSRNGTGVPTGRKSGEFTFGTPADVPANATAVVLNVTATDETGAGFLAAYPSGTANPGTSNVNFPAQFNQANEVLVGLGGDHRGALFVGGGGNPAAHVIVDVVGYLAP